MPLCSTCQAIPFSRLLSEADAAYPHHPSIEALEASAVVCPLCSLLSESLNELRASIANESFDGLASFAEHMARARSPRTISVYLQTIDKYHLIHINASDITEIVHLPRAQIASSSDSPENPVVGFPVSQPRQSSRRDSNSATERPWLYGNWWLLNLPINDFELAPRQLLGIGVRLTEYPEPHQCAIYRTQVIHYRGSSLRVFVDNENPIAPFVPGRLRELNCTSTIALRRVHRWLEACDVHHSCCPTAQQLPTRVLDLGNSTDSTIKLLETDGHTGRYMTLSHCWGPSREQFTTTRQTLGLRKKGIAISELPRTFRDAVILTRKLHVQYLWIDSLCIIQNDRDDWEHEASKMSQVYKNAYLTISASDSTSSSDGCFPINRPSLYIPPECGSTGYNTARDNSRMVSVQLNLSSTGPSTLHFYKEWMLNSNLNNPRIYHMGNYGMSFDPVLLERLSSRAWTLQERLLSPRTLHYGRDQMYWECEAYLISEDGTYYDPAFSLNMLLARQRGPYSDHDLYRSYFSLVEGADPVSRPIGRWAGGWLSMVSDYSKRALTNREDKLPALSGIASIIVAETGDIYLAGLWKSHLIEELHWSIEDSEKVRSIRRVWGLEGEPPKERVPSRAPSWSWASVDASIEFKPLDSDRIVAEVIGGHVTPAGNDSFGKVVSGAIVLKAPLVEITPRDQTIESINAQRSTILGYDTRGTPVQIQLSSGVSLGTVYCDFEMHYPCFALFLDAAHCLVLRRTSTAINDFRRLGIGKFLRTFNQRTEAPERIPGVSVMYNSPEVSSGPIRDQDAKDYVRIL